MKGRFGGTRKLAFCVTHPDFYQFIGTYLQEIAAIFPSSYFHVGLDEFWDFNMCERCKKAMPTLDDEQAMFIKHINKIRDIMHACGKRIMMWSDMFEFYPDVFKAVPRDVIMVDWQYQHNVRNYQGHLLDVDNENRLAVNAACGFETIVAPADRTIGNSRSYFEYADGKPGVIGGLLTCWEKSDTFLYRTLPVFVAAGLQMNGMSAEKAFEAMTVKLFKTNDPVFRSALDIALNCGLLRHFDGVKENAICNRDYYGTPTLKISVCKNIRTILAQYVGKITDELGATCLNDLLDALWEKELSLDAKVIAQDIFDNSCDAERKNRFAAFRQGFADYFDHMSERWQTYRKGILPDVFAERKAGVLKQLSDLQSRLESNAWVKVTGTLPDGYGVENIKVEYKINGSWQTAGSGVFKPSGENVGMFCRFLPLAEDFTAPVEAVRLTASGLGGVGLNFVEICAGAKHYVPRAVLEVSGKVADPAYLLRDNTTFAWFGGQFTRYDYFDRNAAEQKNSVTLEMKEFSVANIAFAK